MSASKDKVQVEADLAAAVKTVTAGLFAVVRATAEAGSAADLRALFRTVTVLDSEVTALGDAVAVAIAVCKDREAAAQQSIDPREAFAALHSAIPSGLLRRVTIGEWSDWGQDKQSGHPGEEASND